MSCCAALSCPQHEQETGKSAGGPDCPSSITMGDLNHAVDRITQGVRRPPLVPAGPGAEERRLAHPQMRTFAATEAGRAVVATLLRDEHGRIESLERVSIVPRGSTLSRTIFARRGAGARVRGRRGCRHAGAAASHPPRSPG